jgi:YD repeat-containing protein
VHTSTDARSSTATTQIAYSDQTFGFTYDQGTNGIGRLSSVSDGSGSTSFAYDPPGCVVPQHTVPGVVLTVGYAYQNAHLSSLTTPSGQTLTYTYNGNNQISGWRGTMTLRSAAMLKATRWD